MDVDEFPMLPTKIEISLRELCEIDDLCKEIRNRMERLLGK